jgi:hypothetical protein
MKRTRLRQHAKSTTPEHAAATALARDSRCLYPGCVRIGCVPAHFPHHRNRRDGGGVWDRENWVPLSPEHHDFIDWRTGGVSDEACKRRERARELLLERARKEWWT